MTFVVGTQWKRLRETLPLSTRNITGMSLWHNKQIVKGYPI